LSSPAALALVEVDPGRGGELRVVGDDHPARTGGQDRGGRPRVDTPRAHSTRRARPLHRGLPTCRRRGSGCPPSDTAALRISRRYYLGRTPTSSRLPRMSRVSRRPAFTALWCRKETCHKTVGGRVIDGSGLIFRGADLYAVMSPSLPGAVMSCGTTPTEVSGRKGFRRR
jgi:hypothetical protein